MQQENYKILVVDDDARLRSLLERYLSEQGFQVRSVANSEQMDRLLTRENFHLMVLDLMLPGEDGLSICRRLRKDNNQLPIVMLTAKGDEIDRIVGLEVGADDYLPNHLTHVSYLRVYVLFFVVNRLKRRERPVQMKKSLTLVNLL